MKLNVKKETRNSNTTTYISRMSHETRSYIRMYINAGCSVSYNGIFAT